MPLASYLAWTAKDGAPEVAARVRATAGCEVVTSDRDDVFIVVTDTPDDLAQKKLHERLTGLPGLEALVLVSAFNDPE